MKNGLSIRGLGGLGGVFLLLAIAVGIAKIPGARADAPPCRYTLGTNVIADKETLLTWERNPDFMVRNWDEAVAHCAMLGTDGGGWRLPTIAELHTLVDDARVYPAIDQTAFPATPAAPHWSSNGANNPNMGWTVNFDEGSAFGTLKTEGHYIRCVR